VRRFTRLTNAFSKKGRESPPHGCAVFPFNFCRVHSTLRMTPAMEAGISHHVWSIEEMCALLPKVSNAAAKAEKKLVLTALGE
jgi:hypothetical protein